MSLLNHSISSIWVRWVMLQCHEGSLWLILDMSCPCGIAVGPKVWRIPAIIAKSKPRLFVTIPWITLSLCCKFGPASAAEKLPVLGQMAHEVTMTITHCGIFCWTHKQSARSSAAALIGSTLPSEVVAQKLYTVIATHLVRPICSKNLNVGGQKWTTRWQ